MAQQQYQSSVLVLIGSERGFCANFNETLLEKVPTEDVRVIAVGHKLHNLMKDDPRVVARIEGARVSEEIARVLTELTTTLARLEVRYGAMLGLRVLYHCDPPDDPACVYMLPPFQERDATNTRQYPFEPLLTLAPQQYFAQLVEHYLFAVMNQALYTSLQVENDRRVQHLGGAARHLENKSHELLLQINRLRQEEITEEIEVILLGGEASWQAPAEPEDG